VADDLFPAGQSLFLGKADVRALAVLCPAACADAAAACAWARATGIQRGGHSAADAARGLAAQYAVRV